MQVEVLFYLDFNKESIYIEKMHCRRHAAQVLGCSYSLARDMLNLNSNDLNGLYRIFLNHGRQPVREYRPGFGVSSKI